jgi:hypothetical protein
MSGGLPARLNYAQTVILPHLQSDLVEYLKQCTPEPLRPSDPALHVSLSLFLSWLSCFYFVTHDLNYCLLMCVNNIIPHFHGFVLHF